MCIVFGLTKSRDGVCKAESDMEVSAASYITEKLLLTALNHCGAQRSPFVAQLMWLLLNSLPPIDWM